MGRIILYIVEKTVPNHQPDNYLWRLKTNNGIPGASRSIFSAPSSPGTIIGIAKRDKMPR